MGFEKRRYISYSYIGGGNSGIRGLVKVNNEKCALEPINPNIHEGFINKRTLYEVCARFEDIQNELDKIYTNGVWELSDSPWVMREHYLQLLVKHKISHMSICLQRDSGGVFISRLDCLTSDQFDYIIRLLKTELSTIERSKYKLYELPKFKWGGI